MAKSAQAFRTIREVADWLGVAAHVLRFWESKFSQIRPVKRAGGRRYYRPSDMELVGGIKVLLHDRGMTIRGVKKLISDEGVAAVAALSPPLDALLEDNDVVDITPDKEWDEDFAAETAVPAPDDATEEAEGETEDAPGAVPPISDLAPPPPSEPPLSAPEPEALTAEPPTSNEADLPTPASSEVREMPPEVADTVTVPHPADSAIARLADIAETPDKLAPHLSALKSLRDRMQDLATAE